MTTARAHYASPRKAFRPSGWRTNRRMRRPANRRKSRPPNGQSRARPANRPAAPETKRATTKPIMKETGWQQHSVRGFFASAVRKKLGLTLVSEKQDGERVYRIVSPESRKGKSDRKAALCGAADRKPLPAFPG